MYLLLDVYKRGNFRAPRLSFQTPTVPTQRLGWYGYCFEKEKESAENTNVYSSKLIVKAL